MSKKQDLKKFVESVKTFKLEDEHGKATAHTSATAVRLDQIDKVVAKKRTSS